MRFVYTYEKDGKRLRGEISAPGRREAIQALLNAGIIPLELKEAGTQTTKPLPPARLALFFKSYWLLLQKGALQEEAIFSLLAEEERGPRKKALKEAAASIRSGFPPHQALEGTGLFPELTIRLLAVGQETGKKEDVLQSLHEYYSRLALFRRKVRSALTYPIIVLGIALLTAYALMTFIVPQFTGMLVEMGASIPTITRIVMRLSEFMRSPFFFLSLLLLALGGPYAWRLALKNPSFRTRYSKALLRLPVVGRIVRGSAISQVFRSLYLAYSASLPLQRALLLAQEAVEHPAYKEALSEIRDEVMKGKSLHVAISGREALFSQVITNMVRSGEMGGFLDQMLKEVASLHEEEVSDIMDNITTLIEPVMIVLVGGTVGGIMLSVLLPYFSLTQSIGTGLGR